MDGWPYREALRDRRQWVQEDITRAMARIPMNAEYQPVEYEAFRRKAAANAMKVFERLEALRT
jgi:hypothetical protein